MIPLLSIFKFFAFVLSAIAAFKLRQSWKTNPQNEAIYCFYKFFFFCAIVFFWFLIPPLKPDLKLAQICFYLVNFFYFIATAYIVKVILIFTYFKKIRNTLFWLLIAIAFSEIVLDLIYFQPALAFTYQFGNFSFISWILNFPTWLMVLHGVFSLIFGMLGVALFLIKGLTQQLSYLRIRSFLLAAGTFTIIFAASGFYFLGYLTPISFWKDLVHGLASVIALFFFLAGIYYKKEEG